ncbi:MAG: hypothetical protein A2498_06305 [Lentisphaerae bacterium RIFOXYC12_FULL_60_16]|nr:MAG: hypothetical protein A2498_06305 [Lentisphaerae bacterium RIFOXYC12_FULL_60_16]OGV73698.1 MAG: hypothetical protein A2269_00440 [Lentisphaerae bacterium RIFOXYA12_FULL_60_10]OGV75070.1 MAG: hypothetical protein A2340_14595 [Lentisphaerae bacterium RIFOXYB12_FULL_60_10]
MTSNGLVTRRFARGDLVFRDGDQAQEAYRIVEGFVSIWRDNHGERVNVGTRGDGEIIGEMALLDDTVRSANVTAESDLVVEVITPDVLQSLLDGSPAVLAAILHQLLESLRTANDMLGEYQSRLRELEAARPVA